MKERNLRGKYIKNFIYKYVLIYKLLFQYIIMLKINYIIKLNYHDFRYVKKLDSKKRNYFKKLLLRKIENYFNDNSKSKYKINIIVYLNNRKSLYILIQKNKDSIYVKYKYIFRNKKYLNFILQYLNFIFEKNNF